MLARARNTLLGHVCCMSVGCIPIPESSRISKSNSLVQGALYTLPQPDSTYNACHAALTPCVASITSANTTSNGSCCSSVLTSFSRATGPSSSNSFPIPFEFRNASRISVTTQNGFRSPVADPEAPRLPERWSAAHLRPRFGAPVTRATREPTRAHQGVDGRN